MAATYSSFMTTRYYSPVFNTALFDGAFRIYFSQAYESAALKIYHLLQTEHAQLWNEVRRWSVESKDHVFLLIYPDAATVRLIFDSVPQAGDNSQNIFMQDWDEGLAVGLVQPDESTNIGSQLQLINSQLSSWLKNQSAVSFQDAAIEKQ